MKFEKYLSNNLTSNILFGFTFLLLFYVYGLHETLFYPPQSVHIWRQTNCLSLTQNYYQHNLPLLEPEMHNQFPNDGLSGKSVGEFPVIYYFVAKLWKVFGKHEWIFKLVQNLILLFGVLALYGSLKKVLKNNYVAGFISLLYFTSPMVIFYGPNFLPDVPALSFVFMAWFFALRFIDHRKYVNLWLSALLFCLACLLKVTSSISFIALGGWIVFELLFLKKEERIFNFSLKHFIPFVLVLISIVSWYLYVDHYNDINGGHFSFHGIWPIWDMTREHFFRVIDILDNIYFKEMFWPFTQYLTIGIWVYLLFTIKKLPPVFQYFIIVLPLGFIAQLLMWFQVLDAHDYYMINLLIVFVFIWAIFMYRVNQLRNIFKYAIYSLALLFFVFNVVKCQKQADNRYVGWMNDRYNNLKALIEIEPFFNELGIEEDDKVISINDFSINGSLYYMNRKGYTNFGSDLSKPEIIKQRIEQGAKYMIVTDTTVLSNDYLQPFLKTNMGNFSNVHIYDLREVEKQ